MRLNHLCLALAALVGACAIGPEYRRPDVSMPLQWHAAAGDAGEPTPAAWWGVFGSAELDRLIVAARAGNRDLRAAASRIAQARALVQIAGANLVPSVGVNAGVARDRRTGDPAASKHEVGIGAVFELDFWGRNAQVRDAALARLQGSRHAERAVQVALQAEVATTYFQVLSAQDRLAVARSTLTNTEAVLRLLRVQREAGAISGLEVLRQQALVASVRADLAPIEQQRQQALAALAVLTGRPPQDLGIGATPLEALRLPPVAAGLPSSLLAQRPDILQAEADLVAAHADILAARAALFPSITLTAAGGAESASLATLLRSGHLVYTLAAGLTAPLFDGGRLRGQVALTTAREDELVQVYQQAILTALREVEASLVAAQRLAEQATQQQAVIEHAQAAMRIAELRYRNGAIDFTTVLDAQRVLFAAQAAQSATRLARYAASVALTRALGGGAEGAPQAAPQVEPHVGFATHATTR